MPRVPAAQGRLNHDPGFHLSCDENLSEGWGPPLRPQSRESVDRLTAHRRPHGVDGHARFVDGPPSADDVEILEREPEGIDD